ncbi:hypothetical protein QBC38DRAFT_221302 [Podospora fimiseda]|uniref:Fungal N-terminal domain-containing protein n=1 Tax=Podospora fimiseda TaxID=252190 RepID=A0AAN7GTD3_9PEZI|nr:hypothetical protein QBC38DRAFT_221302 [Podospora fimiseda]
MDPFSILVGSTSLVGAVVNVTQNISQFMKNFRDSIPEMKRMNGHLSQLKQILEILDLEDLDDNDDFYIKEQINSCMEIVEGLEQLILSLQQSRVIWAWAGKTAVTEMEGKLKINLDSLELRLNIKNLYLTKDIKTSTDDIAVISEQLHHISAKIDHLAQQARYQQHYGVHSNYSASGLPEKHTLNLGQDNTVAALSPMSGHFNPLHCTETIDTHFATSKMLHGAETTPSPSSSAWSSSTVILDEFPYIKDKSASEWPCTAVPAIPKTEEIGAQPPFFLSPYDESVWTESDHNLSWCDSTDLETKSPPSVSQQQIREPQVDPATQRIRDQFKRCVKSLAPSRPVQKVPSPPQAFTFIPWYERPKSTSSNTTAKRFQELVRSRLGSSN